MAGGVDIHPKPTEYAKLEGRRIGGRKNEDAAGRKVSHQIPERPWVIVKMLQRVPEGNDVVALTKGRRGATMNRSDPETLHELAAAGIHFQGLNLVPGLLRKISKRPIRSTDLQEPSTRDKSLHEFQAWSASLCF
jgi:hypothetical protein